MGAGAVLFLSGGVVFLAYTPSSGIFIDGSLGTFFILVVRTAPAFTILNPVNIGGNRLFGLTIRNLSGGAMGAVTYGSEWAVGTMGLPLNNFQKTQVFLMDGEGPNRYHEIASSGATVPV